MSYLTKLVGNNTLNGRMYDFLHNFYRVALVNMGNMPSLELGFHADFVTF